MAAAQQTLIVICGLPGSGKSTLAAMFRERGWVVINQDELGDRKACEAACWQALARGQSVVVDRCNHNAAQRSHWVTIARQVQQQARQRGSGGLIRLAALCLELPAALCMQRAAGRQGHATLPAEQAGEVIQRFMGEWQYPTQREGFHSVRVVKSSEEAEVAAAALLDEAELAVPQGPAAVGPVEPAIPQHPPSLQNQAGPDRTEPSWFAPHQQQQAQHPQQQHLSAAAQSFTPGLSWQPAAPLQPPPFLQHGPGQQGGQQQGGSQAQQRQRYVSRADAAGSWRRGADAEAPSQAGQDRQQGRSRWDVQPPPQQQQQQMVGNGAPAASFSTGNIVPFPRQAQQAQQDEQPDRHSPRPHPWQQRPGWRWDEPRGPPLDASTGGRVILMFDANGCLTSHTSMRRSAGVHRARPGTHHLRRLKDHFIVGMFSSASAKTIDVALALLEEAAGPGEEPLIDRRLVLHRSHTALAPLAHVQAGGKEWDTVKPLRPYFSRLHRVVLVDDDSHKACPGEEANMLLMPCWRDDDPADNMLEHFVDTLLGLAEKLGDDPDADVRQHTAATSAKLRELAEQEAAARGRQQEGVDAEESESDNEAEEKEEAAAEAAAAAVGSLDASQGEAVEVEAAAAAAAERPLAPV